MAVVLKLDNRDKRRPHKKNVIIPGYGCLKPTFKEFSTTNKKLTTKKSPIKSRALKNFFRKEQTFFIVRENNMRIGIKDKNPKLYIKSK